MTVEIEYDLPSTRALGEWQVDMAKQIEANRGIPIEEIKRSVSGTTLVVSVETDLPSQAVDGILSDIEDHLPAGSRHVETREV